VNPKTAVGRPSSVWLSWPQVLGSKHILTPRVNRGAVENPNEPETDPAPQERKNIAQCASTGFAKDRSRGPEPGRKNVATRVFRPVPGLYCIPRSPTAHAVGYCLSPSGLPAVGRLIATEIVQLPFRGSYNPTQTGTHLNSGTDRDVHLVPLCLVQGDGVCHFNIWVGAQQPVNACPPVSTKTWDR